MTNRLANPDFRDPKAAAVAAADIDSFDMFDGGRDLGPSSLRRPGVLLFWAAIAALLVARVVLFDPAAPRPVGSFAEQIAPLHQTR